VVEIGSNDGTLLRYFQNLGLRVLGIDPAREVARQASQTGVETVAEFFTAETGRRLSKDRGPAAIIAANNVIANIDNVGDMVDGVRELLSPDGIFVFETGYLMDIIEHLLFETIYHEHLDYHSVGPLVKFLSRHSLELIDVKRIPTKGGSLRGIVQHAGGPRPVSSTVPDMIRRETELGLAEAKTYAAYAARIEELKRQLLSLLRRVKEEGKTIGGFGASHSVTTLTHHFELGEFLSFIVDDNPKKQGLFSPGYHIPVLPTSALYDRTPDYVLVLAWRFLRPFMEKNRAYLEQGGHFIVPLPNLEII
jgi:SAM-dependent methyltransferase